MKDRKKPYYNTCPHCKANLDPGERCDCQDALPSIGIDIAHAPDMPCARETIQIMIDGKLTTIYKDEFEEHMARQLFKDSLNMYGA